MPIHAITIPTVQYRTWWSGHSIIYRFSGTRYLPSYCTTCRTSTPQSPLPFLDSSKKKKKAPPYLQKVVQRIPPDPRSTSCTKDGHLLIRYRSILCIKGKTYKAMLIVTIGMADFRASVLLKRHSRICTSEPRGTYGTHSSHQLHD